MRLSDGNWRECGRLAIHQSKQVLIKRRRQQCSRKR